MCTNRIVLSSYKIIKRVLAGRGLTKFSFIRGIKNYALEYFKTELVFVQGNKMYLDKEDCLQLSVNEIIEPVETELFKNKIKNGDIVVDIGANIVYFTLLMAKLVGNNGKTFSFEPEPKNFTILSKNVIINNYKNVVLEKKGVSDYNGTSKFFLSSENTGMHSLHKVDNKGKEIDIDVIKLDDYFIIEGLVDRISMIKIDVEGAELQVLNGMTKILKNGKLKLLIEFIPEHLEKHGTNPSDILKILEDNNFKLYHINEKTKKLEPKNAENILENSKLGRNIYCDKE